jgi:hypothetical protein
LSQLARDCCSPGNQIMTRDKETYRVLSYRR